MTPGKAKHFKTAQFVPAVVENTDLPRDPVRVSFSRQAWNEANGRDECLFDVYRTMDDSTYLGTYYEGALERFVL